MYTLRYSKLKERRIYLPQIFTGDKIIISMILKLELAMKNSHLPVI
jgi:hypothetical protein